MDFTLEINFVSWTVFFDLLRKNEAHLQTNIRLTDLNTS